MATYSCALARTFDFLLCTVSFPRENKEMSARNELIKWHVRDFASDWRRHLTHAFSSRTGRNAQIVLLSQVAAGGFGFLVNLLIIRTLGVDDYGLFSLFSATYLLLGGLFHLGWSDTYVRFGTLHAQAPFFARLRRSVLRRIGVGTTFLAAVALFLSPWVAHRFFPSVPGLSALLPFSIGVALLNGWLSFFLADLRVRADYRALLGANVGAVVVRLVFLGSLLYARAVTLDRVMIAYGLSPFLVMLGCAAYVRSRRAGADAAADAQGEEYVPPLVDREIRIYNRWIFLNIVTYTLIGNTDALILAYYHATGVVADFGVSSRLTVPFYFLITAINTTLLPRLTIAPDPTEVRRILGKLLFLLLPLGGALFLFAFGGVSLLLKLAGPAYATIGPILRLQIFTLIVVLFWQPLAIALQAIGRAKSVAYLSSAQLILNLTLDFIWIPRYGASGAIWAAFGGHVLGLLWVSIELSRRLSFARNPEGAQ